MAFPYFGSVFLSIVLGRVWKDEECRIPLPHSFGPHIDEKDRLLVMRQMCYTVPKNCSVTYNVDMLEVYFTYLLIL